MTDHDRNDQPADEIETLRETLRALLAREEVIAISEQAMRHPSGLTPYQPAPPAPQPTLDIDGNLTGFTLVEQPDAEPLALDDIEAITDDQARAIPPTIGYTKTLMTIDQLAALGLTPEQVPGIGIIRPRRPR